MSKSELYDLLAYLDLEQYEKVVPEIEKKDKEIERLNNIIKEINNAFNDNNIHNNMELVKRIKNINKGIDLNKKEKRQKKR